MQLPATTIDPTFMGAVVAARFGYFADQCLDVFFVESATSATGTGYDVSLAKLTSGDADMAFTDAAALLEANSGSTIVNKPVCIYVFNVFKVFCYCFLFFFIFIGWSFAIDSESIICWCICE